MFTAKHGRYRPWVEVGPPGSLTGLALCMSMRWDALLVRHTAHELDERLARARLTAIRLDGVRRDVVLFFRDSTLLWRLHPKHVWRLLTLHNADRRRNNQLPGFCFA